MIKEITFIFDGQCKLTCPYNDLTIEEISSDYIAAEGPYILCAYPNQELTIELEMTKALMEIFVNSNLSSHIKEIEWIDSLGRKSKEKIKIKHSNVNFALNTINLYAVILYSLDEDLKKELEENIFNDVDCLKPLQSKVKPINIENKDSNVIVW